VFFTDSSEDTLVKGIEAIFRGEYWLPRRLLCAHLERTRTVQSRLRPAATLLTRKEMETLRLLATGAAPSTSPRAEGEPAHGEDHIYNCSARSGSPTACSGALASQNKSALTRFRENRALTPILE